MLASGLESIKLPDLPPSPFAGASERSQAAVDGANAAFEASDLLKQLRERSAANRDKCATVYADTSVVRSVHTCRGWLQTHIGK